VVAKNAPFAPYVASGTSLSLPIDPYVALGTSLSHPQLILHRLHHSLSTPIDPALAVGVVPLALAVAPASSVALRALRAGVG